MPVKMDDTVNKTSLAQRLAERFAARRQYRSTSDWLLSLYDRLLRRSIGRILPCHGRICKVSPMACDQPVCLRLGSTDWLVLEEIFHDHEYGAVTALPRDNVGVILDLGANIGLSIRLWQQVFPGARIVGIEPDNDNLAMCRRNVEASGNGDQVILLHACVAGSAREVFLDRSSGEWACRMTARAEANAAPIRAMTIPQVLELAGIDGAIDLLKCDIEGAEQELFQDCALWINRVRTLVVEIHKPYTVEAFLDDITRAGGRFDSRTLFRSSDISVLMLANHATSDSGRAGN